MRRESVYHNADLRTSWPPPLDGDVWYCTSSTFPDAIGWIANQDVSVPELGLVCRKVSAATVEQNGVGLARLLRLALNLAESFL